MTKSASAAVGKLVTSIIGAVVSPSPAKPPTITVFGPTVVALQELAVHVRNGYIPDINSPVEVFGAAGTIAIVLVLGAPDQAMIDRAAITVTDSVAVEEGRFKRLVEEAAARQIEATAKAEKDAKRTKLIAEQRAALDALEASE